MRFYLAKSLNSKLVIYNMLGKEVSTLVNEKLSAGSYGVEWDGSNYTSGVYFY
jgi:flagellar hook assembly protein FlgD